MGQNFTKIKSQSIQWGFPVVLLNTFNSYTNKEETTIITSIMNFKNYIVIALKNHSKVSYNVLKSDFAILNIPDENNYRKVVESFKLNKSIDEWLTKVESENKMLSRYSECPISMDLTVDHIDEVDSSGIVFVRFKIKNVFVRKNCLNEEGMIIDKNIKPLIYKFRNYYTLDKKPLK